MDDYSDKKVLTDHEEPWGEHPSEDVATAPAPPAYSTTVSPPPGAMAYPTTATIPAEKGYPQAAPAPGSMAYPTTATPPAPTEYPQAPPPPGGTAYPTTATPPVAMGYPQAAPPPGGMGYPGKGPPPGAMAYPVQTQAPAPVAGAPVVMVTRQVVGLGTRRWVNDIFSCFSNCNVCILAFCCPCYLVGLNAESLGESFWLYTIASAFIPVIMQFMTRIKLRSMLGIEGSEVSDFCTICCCQPCAVAQERNEILSAISSGEFTPQIIIRQ